MASNDRDRGRSGAQQAVEDPVCGMMLSPDEAEDTTEYEGETYYFCCSDCKKKFQSNPDEYVP